MENTKNARKGREKRWALLTFLLVFVTGTLLVYRNFYITFGGQLRTLTTPEKNITIIICGIIKNGGDRLGPNLEKARRLGERFQSYRVVVFESNSEDGTKKNLEPYKNDPNFKVLSRDITLAEIRNRTVFAHNKICRMELITWARNEVLSEIRKVSYNGFQYVLWIDLDANKFSIEGILRAFQRRDEWDAVFANGLESSRDRYYYDIYALRKLPQEGLLSLGPEHLGEYWWKYALSQKHKFNFKKDELIPVLSGFAGMGLYRKQLFDNRNYSCVITEEMEKYYSMHWPVITAALPREALSFLNNTVSTNLYSQSNIGGKFSSHIKGLYWKYNSGYIGNVVVCEHVSMHVSMVLEGKRLFIYSPMTFYW
eukprot:gene23832-32219_t